MKVEIGEYPDVGEQKVSVHIDKWDTWNMDTTLSHIVVPMLKQLKATKHGHPSQLTEAGWNSILDEMIFAFESKLIDWEDQYYGPFIEDPEKNLGGEFEWIDHDGLKSYQERISAGFKLFGEYYENLWD